MGLLKPITKVATMPMDKKMYRFKRTAAKARRKGETTIPYKHKGRMYYQNKKYKK